MKTPKLEAKTFTTIRDLNAIPKGTMEEHYRHYRIHVTRKGELLKRIEEMDRRDSEQSRLEMNRAQVELNRLRGAVRNYELFFENLTLRATSPKGHLSGLIRRDFGHIDQLQAEMRHLALASRTWVALAWDRVHDRLTVLLLDDHGGLVTWSMEPLIVLEVTDIGAEVGFLGNRGAYVQALLESIDWTVAERRLNQVREAGLTDATVGGSTAAPRN